MFICWCPQVATVAKQALAEFVRRWHVREQARVRFRTCTCELVCASAHVEGGLPALGHMYMQAPVRE
eukprot:7415580-Alexandrium_andersonii.AAC.1